MYITNPEKIRSLQKKRVASKMRGLSNHILQSLAHHPGQVGKMAAALDSYESRHLDKHIGIYKGL